MTTIFESWNINGIIDFVLIIVGLVLVNVFVFLFLKRDTVRAATVALSVLLITSHILMLEYFYNLLLFLFVTLIIICFIVNLAEVRSLFANKNSSKVKKKEGLIKKNGNDVEKIFDHDSFYNVIRETTLYLSNHKIGAIMTFERKDNLDGFMKNGTKINAPVSLELLITIFYPGTRLHDGAVIIRGNKIVAASVYFNPTTKPLIGKYGSRHRASIGISEVCDAVTIVVSEETGRISIAYNGEIQSYSPDVFIKAFENLMNEDAISLKRKDSNE